jgi:hypothetical protein
MNFVNSIHLIADGWTWHIPKQEPEFLLRT